MATKLLTKKLDQKKILGKLFRSFYLTSNQKNISLTFVYFYLNNQSIIHMLYIQAWIAQLVADQLGTREVRGSKPGKGDNFSMKISN